MLLQVWRLQRATMVRSFQKILIVLKWLVRPLLWVGGHLGCGYGPSILISCSEFFLAIVGKRWLLFVFSVSNDGCQYGCLNLLYQHLRFCYFAMKADLKARKYLHEFDRYYRCSLCFGRSCVDSLPKQQYSNPRSPQDP